MTNSIDTTTSTTATTGTTSSTPTNPNAVLGKNDFLKLLVTQLKYQDPMNPTDDKDFMGNMAQFSSLEQTSNMAQAVEKLGFDSQVSQSISLIGHTITYLGADGQSLVSGVASGVSIAGNAISIKVGDQTIAPSDVQEVS